MATAFAMALDVPVAELIDRIGHDGSEIVCPAEEPGGRRGFHSQECITVALSLGLAATQVELFPASLYRGDHKKVIAFPAGAKNLAGNWKRLHEHVRASRGVIAGRTSRHGHAVAYENGMLFDPDGTTYFFTQEACEHRHFYCQCLWRLDRITR